jgi:hypothetical protein
VTFRRTSTVKHDHALGERLKRIKGHYDLAKAQVNIPATQHPITPTFREAVIRACEASGLPLMELSLVMCESPNTLNRFTNGLYKSMTPATKIRIELLLAALKEEQEGRGDEEA